MRCLNLDWLQVYCLEPFPLDDIYFLGVGLHVDVRPYGTRVFRQMFTVFDEHGAPFVEVRRLPFSGQDGASFLPPNAVHLRFVNRACYLPNAVQLMGAFIKKHGFVFQRIVRIDLALDFVKFDTGDDPAKFVDRYMRGVYSKINQANISAHGVDEWQARRWHSLAWGSPSSSIGTKLYNKTLELATVKDKPYIRRRWWECGLIESPLVVDRSVWRLEFSIKDDGRRVFVYHPNGGSKRVLHPNTLATYWTPEAQLAVFALLASHYFHFKLFEEGRPKNLCRDKPLFRFTKAESFLVAEKVAGAKPVASNVDTLLRRLRSFVVSCGNADAVSACHILIDYLSREKVRVLCEDPSDNSELRALQIALGWAINDGYTASEAQIREIAAGLFSGDAY